MTAIKPIAWAAGLFEGEGTIFAGKERGAITLALSMTDEDVVRHFHATVGIGNVNGPYRREPLKPHWAWSCSTLDAVEVLSLFLPYLGVRRTARANEALLARQEYLTWATRARDCSTCGEEFAPIYRKGVHKVIYCSKRCRWTAGNRKRRAVPSLL